MEQRLIFVDLETGGPNPNRHPIVQIAAIAVDAVTLTAVDEIELKIQFDERRATKYALRKNSYSRRLWHEQAIPESDAAKRFAEFLRRHASHMDVSRTGKEYRLAQLVAHNASFDAEFLHAWYERLKQFFPARRLALCTLQRSAWYFFENPAGAPLNLQLTTLCKQFGVSYPAADAHDALFDVRAMVVLYRSLVAREAVSPGYTTV